MLAEKICKRCKKTESKEWWKCCPEHCTEQGPDVVCMTCKDELHPVCCALNANGVGIQELCGYVKGHTGPHTWETKVPPLDAAAPTTTESLIEKSIRKPKEE